MDEGYAGRLRDSGVVIEFHNILMIQVRFPSSMSREAIINASIGLALTTDYESHTIETFPDGSTRLTLNRDS